MARWYAQGIAEGKWAACRYVKLAAKRYLKMLEAAAGGKVKYVFSVEWAVDVCDFIEKLPLSQGARYEGETIRLQPCQAWWLAAIFGFRRNDPSSPREMGERLTREAYLEIPRGNGKSELLAAIGLYCFCCEGEMGSKVFIGAPKEDQADYVYKPMVSMIELKPTLKRHFGLETTKKLITKASDPSAYIRKISSIADREDGANPHVVIMEELHAQDEGLFSVMDSSLGKRPNNLFMSITTAGNRATGACWKTRNRLINVIEGRSKEENFFGVIYSLDAHEIKDKKVAYSPKSWPKANPMLGISLTPSSLTERYQKARHNPVLLLEFERTRLNIWSNAAGGLVHPEEWKACTNKSLRLDDFKGKKCWIGGDLASRNDICALGLIFTENGKLQIFNRYFVPAKSKGFDSDEVGSMYQGWARDGFLTVTPGGVTDYGFIEEAIRGWAKMFRVEAIVFDSYQSNQILAALYNDGLPAVAMHPGTQHVSDPTKELLAAVEAGRLEHDGHPVTEWMAMNVVGYLDKRGNILPQKEEPNSPRKIDGISALVMANAARLDAQLEIKVRRPSVYETRGLAGWDDDNSNRAGALNPA